MTPTFIPIKGNHFSQEWTGEPYFQSPGTRCPTMIGSSPIPNGINFKSYTAKLKREENPQIPKEKKSSWKVRAEKPKSSRRAEGDLAPGGRQQDLRLRQAACSRQLHAQKQRNSRDGCFTPGPLVKRRKPQELSLLPPRHRDTRT